MSVFWHDVRHILKSSRVEFVWIGLLIGFLLFVLNMFAGIGLGAKQFSETLNDKLGMYFYIKDDPETYDDIYGQVIELQGKLEEAGLEVNFKDKNQALAGLLGDQNADLIDKFEEYGIGNPLPATLNVVFDSEAELLSLKQIMVDYRDIITNVQDIRNPTTLKDQENRNLSAINLGYVLFGSSLVVMAVIFIGIITFILYMLKSKFANFHKSVQIKKLLGAYYSQISGPFVVTTSILLLIGFVIMLILSSVGAYILNHYMTSLLSIDLFAIMREYS
jgi:cell division protein FtsX